jgi:PAS domain S-box-containing protein
LEEKIFQVIKGSVIKVLDEINDAVIIVDWEGRVLYINEGYERSVGITKEKILGKDLNTAYPDDKLIQVLRTGIPVEEEEHYNKTLGVKIVASYLPLKDDQGQITGVIGVGTTSPVYQLTRRLSSFLSVRSQTIPNLTISREKLPCWFTKIVGNDPKFLHCLSLAASAAEADCTVMLRGETGVGKELFAEAIHQSSSRSEFPFIAINCAAIPETLLESELFGYDKGAFTGASSTGKLGKFEEAQGGTLFLDEIGELPIRMQAKLLRFTQEKYIEKVGGSKKIPIDVRIVAATHRNLELMVQQGDFRADLYYRLQVVPVFIPPLWERQEDIPVLAHHFLSYYSEKCHKKLSFSPDAMELLQKYQWPGNVREMANVVEYAVVMCQGEIITRDFLPAQIKGNWQQSELNSLCLKTALEKLEKEVIEKAMAKTNNNKSKAIELLGISRSAFYDKLEKYRMG